jgi:CBS domain-containing protein
MSTPPIDGSYRTPRLEHARVEDAMRHGIFRCPADTSLREAARTMSLHHVHTIVVSDPADGSPWGLLTDQAVVSALLTDDGDCPLRDIAERDLNTISSGEPLLAAAERMREHATSHLLVRDAESGAPTGMLSTLDLAGILAWGEA